MAVTKEMIIGEILDRYPETAQVFQEYGMHCLHCPSARGESVADACMVHDIDPEALTQALNKCIDE